MCRIVLRSWRKWQLKNDNWVFGKSTAARITPLTLRAATFITNHINYEQTGGQQNFINQFVINVSCKSNFYKAAAPHFLNMFLRDYNEPQQVNEKARLWLNFPKTK